MTVDISQITYGEPFPVSVCGAVAVPEGFSNGKAADAAVSFRGNISRNGERFCLEGHMSAEIPSVCALCLADTVCVVCRDIQEVFARENVDIDEWPVTDNALKLHDAFAANILEALPGRVVCGADCKGLWEYTPDSEEAVNHKIHIKE